MISKITWFILGLAFSCTLAINALTFEPEKEIPAVTVPTEYFFSDSIGDHNNYLNIIKDISLAPEGTVITIHLAGYGGNMDTTVHLVNAIEESKATINVIVEGPVYSAHAFLAMTGKNIRVMDSSLLMFHRPAMKVNGEYTSDVRAICAGEKELSDRGQSAYTKCLDQQKAVTRLFERFAAKYVYPYLTQQEIENYRNGHDVYIDGPEMQRRILRRV